MAEAKNTGPSRTLTPLPATARGFGIHISTTKNRDRLAYANNNNVIIRSLANPSDGSVFWGQRCKVTVARFSPNGEWIASGDERGRVLIWSPTNHTIKTEVVVCRKVLDIAWLDDGQRVVAVGEGAERFGRIFAWDSGNNLGEFTVHVKTVLSCDFKLVKNKPTIVSGGEDSSVNVYVGRPTNHSKTTREHNKYVNCVRFSPDGSKFASVGSDSKIVIYNAETTEVLKTIEGKESHAGTIYSCSWAPDSKQLLTVGGDRTAKIWDTEAGAVVKNFNMGAQVDDQQVACLWHNDDYLLTVSLSGAINYLDVNNPDQPKMKILGHNNVIRSLCADSRSGNLFTAGADGRVCVWNFNTGLASWVGGKGHASVLSALANANSEQLVTVGQDDKICVSELKELTYSANAAAIGGAPVALAVGSRDPGLAVVALAQDKVVVARNGNVVSTLAVTFHPTSVAISPDDVEVAVGGQDKKVHIYQLENDTLKEVNAATHDAVVESVHFTADGQYLMAGDRDRAIQVWDRKNYTEARNPFQWKYHNSRVVGVAASPNGQRMASCSVDGSLIVWHDTQTFSTDKRQAFEIAHFGGVNGVQFYDDNNVVTIGDDRAIKIWTLA